jgi:predicted small lipoprotein YifL
LARSSISVFRFAALGVAVAAFMLAGCGRKGSLDPPPASSTQAQPPAQQAQTLSIPNETVTPASASAQAPKYEAAANVDSAIGSDGRPVASKGQKKRLPIDWLIE